MLWIGARMTTPIHYRSLGNWTGNECRKMWDGGVPDIRSQMIEEVTCQKCKDSLVRRGVCPECGHEDMSWVHLGTMFSLGCDHCSATLISGVTMTQVSEALTGLKWWGDADG